MDPLNYLELRYSFAVIGEPGPQGSKRYVGSQGGMGRMVENSAKVGPWREAVANAAAETREVARIEELLNEPLWVQMVFSFVRPRSHYRTGRNSHLLRPDAPVAPPVKPDLSKLLRSTEDALTKVLWYDDALIVRYLDTGKAYVNEDPDALLVPGALIRIWTRRKEVVDQWH